MFATRRLLASRITLFSRDNCSLCTDAKEVLLKVKDRRPFDLQVVDLAKPDAQSWKDLYDFDIPVIHVSKDTSPEESVQAATRATRLMHRFTQADVEATMDRVEGS